MLNCHLKENDESEILEEIVSEKPKSKKIFIDKLPIKVPKKESVADEELSDEETVEKIKPKAVRTQKQIDAFQKVRDKKMENAKLRQK